MRNFIFIISLLLASYLYLYGEELPSFSQDKDAIFITFKKSPSNYNISYHENGANITLNGLKIDKMVVKEINKSKIWLIPMQSSQTFIKIVSPLGNLDGYISVKSDKSNFHINIANVKKVLQPPKEEKKIESPAKSVKPEPAPNPDQIELPESIVDAATKYAKPTNKVSDITEKVTSIPPQEVKPKIENSLIPKDSKKDLANNLNPTTKNSPQDQGLIKMSIGSEKGDKNSSYSFSSNVIKTYLVLGLLCFGVVGLGLIFRKYIFKIKFSSNSKLVNIIYSYQIHPKKNIIVVKILNEYYILGVTESNISIIDKIPSGEFDDEFKIMNTTHSNDKFIKYLKREEEEESGDQGDTLKREQFIKIIQSKLKNYQKNV